MSDEGDDWDELECKAAKCTYPCVLAWHGLVLTGSCFCVAADSKRAEAAKAWGESDDLDDGRPKNACLALHWLYIAL